MAGSRKPNPRHITRFEHIDRSDDHGRKNWRHSAYEHGIPKRWRGDVRIQEAGVVRIARTYAEFGHEALHRYDDSDYALAPSGVEFYERCIARGNELHDESVWTVGHIVWPGDESGPCPDCPHGHE